MEKDLIKAIESLTGRIYGDTMTVHEQKDAAKRLKETGQVLRDLKSHLSEADALVASALADHKRLSAEMKHITDKRKWFENELHKKDNEIRHLEAKLGLSHHHKELPETRA